MIEQIYVVNDENKIKFLRNISTRSFTRRCLNITTNGERKASELINETIFLNQYRNEQCQQRINQRRFDQIRILIIIIFSWAVVEVAFFVSPTPWNCSPLGVNVLQDGSGIPIVRRLAALATRNITL